MKAMVVTEFGKPEVLQMQDMPEPELRPLDLLVEVHATSVNPIDCKTRRGEGRSPAQPPLILGFDVSGVVKDMGSQVDRDRFSVGDKVYASPSLARPGANADRVAVDARTAALRPENVEHVHAATLPLVTITAWEALHHHARLHTGETVLIHGGGGGVGHIAIQLAKLHGAHVITTASREPSVELCQKLSADVIINYQEEDVAQRVLDETGGRGCDVVFDTVGGEVFNQSIDCVAVHGRLVSILPPPKNAPIQKLFMKSASIALEFMGATTVYDTKPGRQGEILQTVTELVEADQLTPHVSHVFDLAQLPKAHHQQETGHTHGKIGIRVQ